MDKLDMPIIETSAVFHDGVLPFRRIPNRRIQTRRIPNCQIPKKYIVWVN